MTMRERTDQAERQGPPISVLTAEIQLILAEKRTSLAVLRTGIAILALPLSVLGLLVATSRYYSAVDALEFLLPLLGMCAALTVAGVWLVVRSLRRLHRQDALIEAIKAENRNIEEFIA